jgi:glutaredoxin 3
MPKKPKIDIYTSRFDPTSIRIKGLLDHCKLDYNEFDVEKDEFFRQVMHKRSGGNVSIPQVFIDGLSIGSFEDLEAYLSAFRSLDQARP